MKKLLQNIPLSIKTLIPPGIMLLTLVVLIPVFALNIKTQRRYIDEANQRELISTKLIEELVLSSAQVQSDVYQIGVLHHIGDYDEEMAALQEQLEFRLYEMTIIFSEIEGEVAIDNASIEQFNEMRQLLDSYSETALQVTQITARDTITGVMFIRSTNAEFEKLETLLDAFQKQQEDTFYKAQAQLDQQITRFNVLFGVSAALIGVIAIVISLVVTSVWISRPIEEITNAMHLLAEGELDINIPQQDRKDEIGEMIRAVSVFRDNAIAKERAEETARAAQKMAGIGRLAAGMAHEINSPLQLVTGVSNRLIRQVNADQIDKDQFLKDLDRVEKSGWRIAKIVRSMLTYARPSVHAMEYHSINEIIADTLLLIEHQLHSWSDITIQQELAENLPPIRCDRNNITQVIINLLENAADSMTAGGWITIRTEQDAQNKQIILQFADSGSGIPESVKDKIFDPFFTTKDIGKGTGLGLSVVQGIITAHGGEISVKSAPEKGSTFTIYLPEDHPPDPAAGIEENEGGRY